jgi:hypothetical protein
VSFVGKFKAHMIMIHFYVKPGLGFSQTGFEQNEAIAYCCI